MSRTLEDLDWPLRTERLLIRPAVADDAAATWAYRRLREVSWWLTGTPTTFEGYAERFREADRLERTLLVEREGTVIGDLYLAVVDGWAQSEVADRARGVQAEIGWAFDPAAQGQGYATESVRALLDLAFRGLGLRRVFAQCFAANEASWRLMERLGMRRETHTVRESLHRTGVWLDGLAYALLADERPASTR